MDSDTLKFVANFLAKKIAAYLASALVTIGALHTGSDQASFVTMMTGVIVGLIAFIWSWWNDRGKQLVLATLAKAHRIAPASASTAAASNALVESVNDNKVVAAGGAVKIVSMLAFGLIWTALALADGGTSLVMAQGASTALTPQVVAQKIQQLAKPDVAYAMQLAKSVNTPQGNVRAQCYQAISDALPNPPSGAAVPPAPHLVTNVEELAEVIDALQPGSPLFVNCGGAAQLVGQNVLIFINAIVTGFLGATKALPLIPIAIP